MAGRAATAFVFACIVLCAAVSTGVAGTPALRRALAESANKGRLRMARGLDALANGIGVSVNVDLGARMSEAERDCTDAPGDGCCPIAIELMDLSNKPPCDTAKAGLNAIAANISATGYPALTHDQIDAVCGSDCLATARPIADDILNVTDATGCAPVAAGRVAADVLCMKDGDTYCFDIVQDLIRLSVNASRSNVNVTTALDTSTLVSMMCTPCGTKIIQYLSGLPLIEKQSLNLTNFLTKHTAETLPLICARDPDTHELCLNGTAPADPCTFCGRVAMRYSGEDYKMPKDLAPLLECGCDDYGVGDNDTATCIAVFDSANLTYTGRGSTNAMCEVQTACNTTETCNSTDCNTNSTCTELVLCSTLNERPGHGNQGSGHDSTSDDDQSEHELHTCKHKSATPSPSRGLRATSTASPSVSPSAGSQTPSTSFTSSTSVSPTFAPAPQEGTASASVSASDSVSLSATPSRSPGSQSPTVSVTSSMSVSATRSPGSQSPTVSVTSSMSVSATRSPGSQSPTVSVTSSTSVTATVTPSPASQSPTSSISTSTSVSPSPASHSLSASVSGSASESASPSASVSASFATAPSNSSSPTVSDSATVSVSPVPQSASASESASLVTSATSSVSVSASSTGAPSIALQSAESTPSVSPTVSDSSSAGSTASSSPSPRPSSGSGSGSGSGEDCTETDSNGDRTSTGGEHRNTDGDNSNTDGTSEDENKTHCNKGSDCNSLSDSATSDDSDGDLSTSGSSSDEEDGSSNGGAPHYGGPDGDLIHCLPLFRGETDTCSSLCADNFEILLREAGCCSSCLIHGFNATVRFRLPSLDTCLSRLHACENVTVSVLDTCPKRSTARIQTLIIDNLRYTFVNRDLRDQVKADVRAAIAEAAGIEVDDVIMKDFTNSTNGVQFTYYLNAGSDSMNTLAGEFVQSASVQSLFNLTAIDLLAYGNLREAVHNMSIGFSTSVTDAVPANVTGVSGAGHAVVSVVMSAMVMIAAVLLM